MKAKQFRPGSIRDALQCNPRQNDSKLLLISQSSWQEIESKSCEQ